MTDQEFIDKVGKAVILLGIAVCVLSLLALADQRSFLWAGGFSSGTVLMVLGNLFLSKNS